MPILKDIRDKESTSRKYGGVQALTDTKTRDKEEKEYFNAKSAFENAKKAKNISDRDYAVILRYFSNNIIKAQNAVINKGASSLRDIVKNQLAKENPPKTDTAPPVQPKDTPDEPTSTPTKLPNIVKPSQQNPDRITDSGSGEYSEFRKQKHLKNISDEDFKWIFKAFNENRGNAEEAVIKYSENALRSMIANTKSEIRKGITDNGSGTSYQSILKSNYNQDILWREEQDAMAYEDIKNGRKPDTPWGPLKRLREKNDQNSDNVIEKAQNDFVMQLLLPEEERYLDSKKLLLRNETMRDKFLGYKQLYENNIGNGLADDTGVYYEDSSLQVGGSPWSIVSFGGEVGAGYVINVKEGWIAQYTHIGPSVGLGALPVMIEESRGPVYGNATIPKNYTNGFWQSNLGALIEGSANATAEFNEKDEIVQKSNDFNLTGAGAGASYGFYILNDVEYYRDSINNGE